VAEVYQNRSENLIGIGLRSSVAVIQLIYDESNGTIGYELLHKVRLGNEKDLSRLLSELKWLSFCYNVIIDVFPTFGLSIFWQAKCFFFLQANFSPFLHKVSAVCNALFNQLMKSQSQFFFSLFCFTKL
jgi:hypothetical protein